MRSEAEIVAHGMEIMRQVRSELAVRDAMRLLNEWIGLAMISTTPEGHYVMDRERFLKLIEWVQEGMAIHA